MASGNPDTTDISLDTVATINVVGTQEARKGLLAMNAGVWPEYCAGLERQRRECVAQGD